MLGRALDVGKSWLPSRMRQPVYQQWLHRSDPTELRTLTSASAKSGIEFSGDTEYQPHKSDDRSQSTISDTKRSWLHRLPGPKLSGWRFGALHFAVWASVVFLINLIVTIWSSASHHSNRGVLFEGDCDRVKRLNTALHILINILSTILLSGSNYCMQCLSAPTRKEVDKAHARGTWLDIGVPSLRNVRHLSRLRIALWVLFGLTSLPLHLFYNSAVFASLSSNNYFAFSVSKSFVEDVDCLGCTNPIDRVMAISRSRWRSEPVGPVYADYYPKDIPTVLQNLHRTVRDLDRLEPAECLNQYATSIQTKRRNLLLVASNEHFPTIQQNNFSSGSHVYWASPFYSYTVETVGDSANAYSWMCSGLDREGDCADNIDKIKADPSAWRVGAACSNKTASLTSSPVCQDGAFPVEYCLSEPAEPHCRLQFDTTISVIVTVLNLIKAALMLFVALRIPDDPLITMGDAVASFLKTSDPYSKNMCLLSIHDVKGHGYQTGPREWVDTQFRWRDVTSKKRRGTTIAMFSMALSAVVGLLVFGMVSLPLGPLRTFSGLVKLGFGTVDTSTAINVLVNNLIFNAVLANSPQVVLSLLYFSYNALFTAYLLSHEWTSYAHKQKGLRTSRRPVGSQRTTYFLQLPYRFGIPLMVLSGTLHWLVSQSIFLIAIDFYDVFGKFGSGRLPSDEPFYNYGVYSSDMKTCGYSPIAMISVLVLGSFMLFAIIAFGYVPYKRGMTLCGSCSMAISAACHLDKEVDADGEATATDKLQWGVIGTTENGVGHCGFSAGSVGTPVVGQVYAGTRT